MSIMREILQSSDDSNENNYLKEGEKFSTTIQRDDKQNGHFGFSIAGGNQPTMNENENLYISKVNNHEKKSSVAVGDRLLAINGHNIGDISHDQALDMINNGGNNVELILYREKISNGNHNTMTTNINNTIEVSLKGRNGFFENMFWFRKQGFRKGMDQWG
jgi:hypothetical protein